MNTLRQPGWWKEAVVYQVYPRSFQDSNNDGIGDLPGILSRLDYIQSLGVDAIWLNPFFKSPNDDGGYDVSDYLDIQPEFGTMADFDRLLHAAHERGLKIIIDLVFNHTSDEHQWFVESSQTIQSPKRDYYFWREGRGDEPPSNWPSFFGGSAWQKDEKTGQYYLHLFSRKQPDLNWEHPEVREELKSIIHYWTNKGVDGIRLDVISAISKRNDFQDADTTDFNEIIARYYANGPRIFEFIGELRASALADPSLLTVGEGPGINAENAIGYLSKGKGLDMIFHFDHMFLDQGPGGRFDPKPWSMEDFKMVFRRWDDALYKTKMGWGSIFLGNHDFPRQVSRWGNDGEFREVSAKAILTLLMTLRGTPFIYAGDELGMTNIELKSVSQSRDVETLNGFKTAQARGLSEAEFLKAANYAGRDNARTPFQWDDSVYAGFSGVEPWMKVNPNNSIINRESQEKEPDSVLNYFRKLIRLRKLEKTLVYGEYQPLETNEQRLMTYKRYGDGIEWMVLINFSSEYLGAVPDETGFELILSNVNEPPPTGLAPWEAKILKKIK